MVKRIKYWSLVVVLLLQTVLFTFGADTHTAGNSIDSLNEQAYRQLHVNMSKALAMLTDAEQLCIKSNYQKGLAVNYLYQGEVYYQRGYYKRAANLFNHSLKSSRQFNDVYNIARAQEQISLIEKNNGNYISAEQLLANSLNILKSLNKPIDIINIELKIGVIKESQKKYKEALTIYQNACKEAKNANYLYGEKKTYFNRAYLYANTGRADSSIYYYNKALALDTKTKDKYGKALSYIGLSKIYLKQNDLNKVSYYASLAQLNADSVHAQLLLENAIELLLNVSTKKNDFHAIAYWQDKLLKTEREISEDDRNNAAVFIEVLKQQQERQLAVQKQIKGIQKVSQTKTIILVCFFIIMVIVVMLVLSISYNYKKAKAYAKELNEKNKLIEEHARSVANLNNKIIGQNNILEEDNNLKNKLLSVISHDLRHPLTSTKSIIELVNMKLVSQDEAKNLFSKLEAQYSRVLTLLDNLLYWIKSQVHGDTIKRVEINLYAMIEDLIDEQKLTIQNKKLEVVNSIESELNCFAELELLKIIFRNLLSNAIKFTHHNGKITFISEQNESEVRVSVVDSGIGMNTETLKRLNIEGHFTSKGTEDEEGSGLGLMLIRDLIKKVNGNLSIESQAGQGSTFTVCLTLVEEPALQESN